jgi:hypothetical protein
MKKISNKVFVTAVLCLLGSIIVLYSVPAHGADNNQSNIPSDCCTSEGCSGPGFAGVASKYLPPSEPCLVIPEDAPIPCTGHCQ